MTSGQGSLFFFWGKDILILSGNLDIRLSGIGLAQNLNIIRIDRDIIAGESDHREFRIVVLLRLLPLQNLQLG